MATTSTDPRDIEADLERERASLASTLDALSDRVSVDNLAREALGMIRSQAGTATTKIDHAVRANPVAMALIGAGIAWMFLGPRVTGGHSSDSSNRISSEEGTGYGTGSYGSSSYGSSEGSYAGASSPYGSYGGATSSGSGYASGSTGSSGYAAGSSGYTGGSLRHDDAGYATSGQGSSEYGRVGYVPSDNDEDHAWSQEAHGLRARAAAALRRIEEEAKSYYDSLRNGISGGASSARDFAAERASVVSRFSSDLRGRFSSGLDNLPPEARERVIAARERAYGAMLRAEQMGRDVWRDPGRSLEEHPLVAGAVGFALGAAVGAILPSTDVENRTFGAERDRLMDEAARALRQERERAMQLASSLGDEIRSTAKDTMQAVAGTVTEKAQEAAGEVAETVTEKAQDSARRMTESASQGTGGTGSMSSGSTSSGSGMTGPGDPVIR